MASLPRPPFLPPPQAARATEVREANKKARAEELRKDIKDGTDCLNDSVAVAKVMLQPGAEAALGGLRQAGKQVPQQVPVDGEPRVATPEVLSKLLADEAAPAANHPAFALYLRDLGTSGSMTL